MKANLKIVLASIGTAALLVSPAVAESVSHSYYPPQTNYYYAPSDAYGYYAPSDPYGDNAPSNAYGYYAPSDTYGSSDAYGYEYSAPYYSYRRGDAMGNPNYHHGSCVRRAFPQCSGG
jgi:hypothetical protein